MPRKRIKSLRASEEQVYKDQWMPHRGDGLSVSCDHNNLATFRIHDHTLDDDTPALAMIPRADVRRLIKQLQAIVA